MDWIRLHERKPEPGMTVLVLCDRDHIHIATVLPDGDVRLNDDRWEERVHDDEDAVQFALWMPMPGMAQPT